MKGYIFCVSKRYMSSKSRFPSAHTKASLKSDIANFIRYTEGGKAKTEISKEVPVSKSFPQMAANSTSLRLQIVKQPQTTSIIVDTALCSVSNALASTDRFENVSNVDSTGSLSSAPCRSLSFRENSPTYAPSLQSGLGPSNTARVCTNNSDSHISSHEQASSTEVPSSDGPRSSRLLQEPEVKIDTFTSNAIILPTLMLDFLITLANTLNKGWIRSQDPSENRSMYVNLLTGASSYTCPGVLMSCPTTLEPLVSTPLFKKYFALQDGAYTLHKEIFAGDLATLTTAASSSSATQDASLPLKVNVPLLLDNQSAKADIFRALIEAGTPVSCTYSTFSRALESQYGDFYRSNLQEMHTLYKEFAGSSSLAAMKTHLSSLVDSGLISWDMNLQQVLTELNRLQHPMNNASVDPTRDAEQNDLVTSSPLALADMDTFRYALKKSLPIILYQKLVELKADIVHTRVCVAELKQQLSPNNLRITLLHRYKTIPHIKEVFDNAGISLSSGNVPLAISEWVDLYFEESYKQICNIVDTMGILPSICLDSFLNDISLLGRPLEDAIRSHCGSVPDALSCPSAEAIVKLYCICNLSAGVLRVCTRDIERIEIDDPNILFHGTSAVLRSSTPCSYFFSLSAKKLKTMVIDPLVAAKLPGIASLVSSVPPSIRLAIKNDDPADDITESLMSDLALSTQQAHMLLLYLKNYSV